MSLPTMTLLGPAALAEGIVGQQMYKNFEQSVAEQVAENASALAPGSEGDYIEAVDGKVVFSNPRGVWHIIEYGSVNNTPYSPLRRAVTSAGLRLDEAPKP